MSWSLSWSKNLLSPIILAVTCCLGSHCLWLSRSQIISLFWIVSKSVVVYNCTWLFTSLFIVLESILSLIAHLGIYCLRPRLIACYRDAASLVHCYPFFNTRLHSSAAFTTVISSWISQHQQSNERLAIYIILTNNLVSTIFSSFAMTTTAIVCMCVCVCVTGRDGSLVDSWPFVRRVAGSNPALAAT